MVDEQLRPWLLEVNCSPALGIECAADREVKEPLIADLVDLLGQQREQVVAGMPAGGGARAAKARGWPGRAEGGGEGGGRRRSPGDAAGGGEGGSTATVSKAPSPPSKPSAPPLPKRGGRAAWAEAAANSPNEIGGYELIFPFNAATQRLASNVGGNEAQIVAEIRSELQRRTAHQDSDKGAAEGAAGDVSDACGEANEGRRDARDARDARDHRRERPAAARDYSTNYTDRADSSRGHAMDGRAHAPARTRIRSAGARTDGPPRTHAASAAAPAPSTHREQRSAETGGRSGLPAVAASMRAAAGSSWSRSQHGGRSFALGGGVARPPGGGGSFGRALR